MTWAIFIQLILQYGLPFATKLSEKWGSDSPVTDEEKAELLALAKNTAQSVTNEQLLAAGIDPNSPEAQALLKLLPPPPPVLHSNRPTTDDPSTTS